ncbi:transcription-repair coupling factor [Brevibacillus composti]|uniref:Transcription-repair-coupling factor n=1 Tax=Brevibacillus composti TaxID=2796470 RepID=A0A7T5EL53_9BACL|nr:transcription-repair coupling factor [Brevibacillus composti]QQE74562.1 transcription-repair coupling factor [Brevibacillus composti]QUO41645.1 transcription-repair coupling factor [Brevibacillus composti]
MQVIINPMKQDAHIGTIVAGLETGLSEQLVSGLAGSARQALMVALRQMSNRPICVITHNMFQAQKVYEDLIELVPAEDVLLYPGNELIGSELAVASPDILAQRIHVCNRLAKGFTGFLVVPYAGLRRLAIPPHVWKESQIELSVGQELDIDAFLLRCIELGYERVDMVERKGELSVRGGIVDLYPIDAEWPVRIELFDVEIDSIRSFDMATQRSLESIQSYTIGPAKEMFASTALLQESSVRLEQKLGETVAKLKDAAAKEKVVENIGGDVERMKQGQRFPHLYSYISVIYPEQDTLLSYMPQDTVLIVDEPSRVLDTAAQLQKEEGEWLTGRIMQGEYMANLSLSRPYEEIISSKQRQIVYLSLFLRQSPKTQPQNIVNLTCRTMQNFHGQMNVLKTELARWKKAQDQIVFVAADLERAKRLERVLHDYEMEADLLTEEASTVPPGRPTIILGNLQTGFELPLNKLVVITEGEVFTAKQRKARKVQQTMTNAERIKNYLELKPGDYVVHINHGIGKYLGIETKEILGIHKDYLHIQYAGGDSLFVPIEQIDHVQKYVASEESQPKVYSLGGSEWKRVKNKVQSSVKDIAEDLIKLYAAREAAVGHAFSRDTEEQREFEAMFPYQETPDQLRAIAEVKQDMEKRRPMDRLVCGDVGYGKTEVAIRAAFKAVMEGKQVAVLVPTTILAQQHYETFRERFADYPIRVEVLSRFRSRKEQNATMKGLKDGIVDVVIGTHRLLSKDIQFRDLGLLIVDEEQRFGVSHKEKLKQLKTNVDVLTLTATPIPRTLHMSMIGVRDLSVIETPPENRFPVQTYVMEYSPALVREAIEREMARGGQVFFLYNQVQGIEQMAEQISMLVPDARIAVAHGQMNESELESVILDFLEGNYDVLVSTTIIETGVDIPNVNTLIIHNADKMGLSQLYQLRGRVGRSNRIAYAYFTYQRDKVLTEVAEKRLQAIKEFTELGSGFKIAMRDLSIRGAGNLLGAEQHGFINSVGFDLYSQMLKDAIDELKGEVKQEAAPPVEINLQLDAYLPSTYITDSRQKIEMYKKFVAVSTLEDVDDLAEELLDRFGPLTKPVENLLTISRLRVYALEHKITEISQKNPDEIKLFLHPSQNNNIDGGALFALASNWSRRVGLSGGQQIVITVKVKGLREDEGVQLVEKLLRQFHMVRKDTSTERPVS